MQSFRSCSVPTLLLLLGWTGIHATNSVSPSERDSASPVIRTITLQGRSHVEHILIVRQTDVDLSCSWTGAQNEASNITGFWRKDGNEVVNSHITVQKESEQYSLQKVFRIGVGDLGIYSCVFNGSNQESKVDFILKVPEMHNVKEKTFVSYVGDSVVMGCKIDAHPETWHWYRANGSEKMFINSTAEPLRYSIEIIAKNQTKLTLMNVTEKDSGTYLCGAIYEIHTSMKEVELRVISFLEPLKPFFAIVAEVILLVSLILFCELRNKRTRRHSATDNGMHGDQTDKVVFEENSRAEESTTLRQRQV